MMNRAASVRAALLAAALLGALAVWAVGPGQGATIRIVRPEADTTVYGNELRVELEVEGVVLGGQARNGAFALLTLDDMPPVKSLAATFTFRSVRPGEHRLVAELRRLDGSPFEPDSRSEARFRTETAGGGSAEPSGEVPLRP